MRNVFNEKVMLTTLKYTTHYTEVPEALKTIARVLQLDISVYENLTLTAKVDKALCRNWYDTSALLLQTLRDAAEVSGSGNSSGSSGGGGGGGFAGGKTQTTVVSGERQDVQKPVDTKPSEIIFSDLAEAAWAEEAILGLNRRGIVSGYGDAAFRPNSCVSREEFTKIIVLAYGLYDEKQECDFLDVDKSAWYYRYIASAKAAGIIVGRDETTFGTGGMITRQEMAAVLHRSAVLAKIDFGGQMAEELIFDDWEEIDGYAQPAVAALYGKGILCGDGNGCFAPGQYATRAECCKVVWQMIEQED